MGVKIGTILANVDKSIDEGKKAVEQKISGVPQATFNDQVLLLDAYLGNLAGTSVEIAKTAAVPMNAQNVPELSTAFETINNLAFKDKTSLQKIQKYIDNITPAEMAQILPDISIKIINAKDYNSVYVVPLTDPGNISAGFAGAGYYTTRTVGLKSLEVFLDGDANPFFGTAYQVNMELVFDSINTFFDSIPGGGGSAGPLTFAQAFRSPGRVASGDYFTRLEIGMASQNKTLIDYTPDSFEGPSGGMSTDPNMSDPGMSYETGGEGTIEDKYELKSGLLSLCLNLQLIKTSIQIDENLRTILKVSYISQEEGLFKSQEMFDFLGLDLKDQTAEMKKQSDEARIKKAQLDAAAQEHRRQKELDIKVNAEPIVRKIKTVEDKIATLKAKRRAEGSISTFVEINAGAAGNTFDTTVNIDTAIRLFEEQLKKERKALESVENELKNLQERDIIEDFKSELGQEAYDEVESKLKTSKRKLANLRTEQIDKAIEKLLDDPKLVEDGIIKNLEISADELQNYYAQGYQITFDAVKKKNLGVKPGPTSMLATGAMAMGTFAGFFNNPGQGSETQPATVKTEAEAEAEAKKAINDTIGAGIGLVAKGIRKFQNFADPTISAQYPSEESIVKSLSNFKNIRYILFGDFVRLIFKRLYELLPEQEQKSKPLKAGQSSQDQYGEILNRTIILLSTAKFKNFESNGVIEDSIYNIPISIKQIKYILIRNTYQKTKNFFTLFEMLDKLTDLISNARRRKANILNVVDFSGGFSLSKKTYSLAKSGGRLEIAPKEAPPSETLHGMLFHIERTKEDSAETTLKPRFVYGSVDRGIIKSFQISGIQDDSLAKMVDEQLQSSGEDIIPIMFECELKLFPALFFHLGTVFQVVAPAVATKSNGFFLEGDYRAYGIRHTYSAGGSFESKITGIMDSTNSKIKSSAKGNKPTPEEVARQGQELYKKMMLDKEKLLENPGSANLSKLGFDDREVAQLKNALAQNASNPIRKAAEEKIRKRILKE